MAHAHHSQRGSALILALGFMVVVLVIAAGVHGYVIGQLQASGAQGRRVAADYLAQGAVARALGWFQSQAYQLPDLRTLNLAVPATLKTTDAPVNLPTNHPGEYTDVLGKVRSGVVQSYQNFLTDQTTGVGTYSVTASLMSAVPEMWEVVAIAQVGNVTRQAGVLVQRPHDPLFEDVLFGRDGLKFSGNAGTDAYDSSVGPYGGLNRFQEGHVGSNGDITLGGGAVIDGNATPGPTGSVTFGGGSVVTGSTNPATEPKQLSAVTLPDILVNQGIIKLANAETLTLVTGNYLVSSIEIKGSASLIADNVSGPVNLYVTGKISVSGNGITNMSGVPANLFITQIGGAPVNFSGGSAFSGAVYAPDSTLSLSGGGQVYGAFVGASVDMTGNGGGFHYDLALRKIPGPPGPLRVVAQW